MPGSSSTGILTGTGRPPIPPPLSGGDDDSRGRGASRRASFTGLMVLLAASVMLIAAFTSAFVVRRGLSDDWVTMPLPRILWVNTAVLLASSVALELARRALKSGRRTAFNRFWTAGTVLGLVFLAGQYAAWQQLYRAGIYIATNPSSSFFFLLTCVHAVHLIGGIGALGYVNIQALRLRLGPGKRTAVDVCAVFWHFLDGMWVYLLLLFLIWG
ncbi:MAG: cytochrome c oxidase subunit 3 [Candidatus Solibacter usitatus]|nr:cytochrome c oxidase subunit 3 [Candidatus Solibacter usitatus]